MKSIALGIQTLSKIINNNKIYVDKTKQIIKLITNNTFVFASRPRGFGKSLAIDTMKEMFLGNKELFKGLYAYENYKDWDKSYPIIHMSLIEYQKVNNNNIQDFLKKRTVITIDNKEISLNNYYKGEFTDLSSLIEYVYKNTGKEVVVLIDEYDTPFTQNLDDEDGFYKIKDFFYGFYGGVKNKEKNIKFFYFSGLAKVAQTALFSTLNNLNNITFNKSYYDFLGYTEKEILKYYGEHIKEVIKELNITEEKLFKKLRIFYDGYTFGDFDDKLYNPWSINNFFENKIFMNYGLETGNSSLSDFIFKHQKIEFSNIFNQVETNGKVVFDVLNNKIDTLGRGNTPTLLLNAGYLTFTDERYKYLKIANNEARVGLVTQYVNYLKKENNKFDDYYNIAIELSSAILEGKADKISEWLLNLKNIKGSPYEWMDKNPEGFMKDALFFILRLMGLAPQGELQNTNGRTDITFEENGLLYIIEYKIDGALEEGLKQINEKYLNQFTNNKGYKIVINYKKKTTKDFEVFVEKFG